MGLRRMVPSPRGAPSMPPVEPASIGVGASPQDRAHGLSAGGIPPMGRLRDPPRKFELWHPVCPVAIRTPPSTTRCTGREAVSTRERRSSRRERMRAHGAPLWGRPQASSTWIAGSSCSLCPRADVELRELTGLEELALGEALDPSRHAAPREGPSRTVSRELHPVELQLVAAPAPTARVPEALGQRSFEMARSRERCSPSPWRGGLNEFRSRGNKE